MPTKEHDIYDAWVRTQAEIMVEKGKVAINEIFSKHINYADTNSISADSTNGESDFRNNYRDGTESACGNRVRDGTGS